MIESELEVLKAAYELATLGDWSVHRPQARSASHIVALDKDGYIEQYVAERFTSHDDAMFVIMVKNAFPALIAEIERLRSCLK